MLLSVDYDQLAGKTLSEGDSSTNCEDYNKNKHLFEFYPQFNDQNSPHYKQNLDPEGVMHPCGLFACLY